MRRSILGLAVIGLAALGGMFAACGSSTDGVPATSSGSTSSGAGGAASSSSSSSSASSSSSSSTSGAGGHGGQGGAGVGGAGGAGGGFTCAPLLDDCSKCTFTSCNSLYCACEASADCSAVVLCVLTCADSACIEACYVAHPNGIAQTTLVAACADTNCNAQCPQANNPGVCEICAATKCPMEVNSCYGDANCAALIQCVRNCAKGDAACQQQCALTYPGAIVKAENLRNCVQNDCAAECASF